MIDKKANIVFHLIVMFVSKGIFFVGYNKGYIGFILCVIMYFHYIKTEEIQCILLARYSVLHPLISGMEFGVLELCIETNIRC